MKLLNKRDIDKAKADDRAREVAEGQKLAKRVDVLRETAAEEEKHLEEYRTKTLSAVTREIQAKEQELVALTDHVERLKLEREALYVPLDAEWEKLHKEQRTLEKLRTAIDAQALSLALREEGVVKREQEAKVEFGRAENLKHLAALDRSRAAQVIADARADASEKTQHADSLLAQAELREQDVLRREAHVAARERDVDNRWTAVQKYEEKLFNNELALRDRWRALEEEIAYVKPK